MTYRTIGLGVWEGCTTVPLAWVCGRGVPLSAIGLGVWEGCTTQCHWLGCVGGVYHSVPLAWVCGRPHDLPCHWPLHSLTVAPLVPDLGLPAVATSAEAPLPTVQETVQPPPEPDTAEDPFARIVGPEMTPYYHGVISKGAAESLVARGKKKIADGRFLFRSRDSENRCEYLIALAYQNTVTHHRLERRHTAEPFLLNKRPMDAPCRTLEQVGYGIRAHCASCVRPVDGGLALA